MRITVIVFGLVAVPVLHAQRQLPPLLPPDREMALAESAAPRAVTDEASIFLLHRGGFVIARQGNNGFTCFVARSATRRNRTDLLRGRGENPYDRCERIHGTAVARERTRRCSGCHGDRSTVPSRRASTESELRIGLYAVTLQSRDGSVRTTRQRTSAPDVLCAIRNKPATWLDDATRP